MAAAWASTLTPASACCPRRPASGTMSASSASSSAWCASATSFRPVCRSLPHVCLRMQGSLIAMKLLLVDEVMRAGRKMNKE